MSARSTSEKQAVKRSKARAESKHAATREMGYFIRHRWLPKNVRRTA